MKPNSKLIDMSGQVFGLWHVQEKAGNYVGGAALWLCKCGCGTQRVVLGSDLRSGKSASCGCAHKEAASKANTTHGLSKTRLHRIWKAMRTRCNNPNIPGAQNYSGRGISICAEWAEFMPFRDWAIRSGYAENLSIERIDVNGNYCPENCTWATDLEQSINRRFVLKNSDGTAWSQIAKANGIQVTLMHSRIHEGWPAEKAATLPKGSRLRDH